MLIRVEGTDLPGRSCAGPAGRAGYENIHVAVQRRERPAELLDPVRADVAAAVWTLECTSTVTPGGIDLTGRYVQGRPGERFIYLNWGTVDPADGGFTMFRRAKLWLTAVPADVLAAAVESGLLVGRLGLTDAKGHPTCASVRPPQITWSAASS
ncbi:monooxygenase [Frankia sp. AgB1.9]|uniref:DUF5990 family protein n=1 Tax=unclassified Frankia TaxID=2632575 RepID=UPI0019334068|nr:MULTISPECIES: DUF5990 family protein [unclassified Frankia]MBL7490451.1 monooxygenase [Frankia sp. AgW1.1]MBL7548233.1 monooxygenase [Frankia sp. AgB1.9]MBL7621685.1 monooxygenase [Frankia sp. AgB1.8]